MKKNSFTEIIKAEMLLFIREPSAFFFTLIFPLLMMLLFSSIWGNDPFPGEFFGYLDFSVGGYMGMVMATGFFMSLTVTMATYREKGILKRFRATPVSPFAILVGQLVSVFAVTVAGVILLLIAGYLLFNLQFFGNIFEFILAFLLSSASIAALGFIPASLAPTARSGVVLANTMYFPMLFLSGATLPRSMLPQFLQDVSQVFPLTHAISLMQKVWLGEHIWDSPVHIAVLSGFILAGLFVSVKFFKWE